MNALEFNISVDTDFSAFGLTLTKLVGMPSPNAVRNGGRWQNPVTGRVYSGVSGFQRHFGTLMEVNGRRYYSAGSGQLDGDRSPLGLWTDGRDMWEVS